jgi:uncharacterized membrane protein YuzA (DUF378 family)
MHVGGIFCYLAKAFYGIQGIAAEWFISYLADRKQKVKIRSSCNTQNFFSNWGTVKTWELPKDQF